MAKDPEDRVDKNEHRSPLMNADFGEGIVQGRAHCAGFGIRTRRGERDMTTAVVSERVVTMRTHWSDRESLLRSSYTETQTTTVSVVLSRKRGNKGLDGFLPVVDKNAWLHYRKHGQGRWQTGCEEGARRTGRLEVARTAEPAGLEAVARPALWQCVWHAQPRRPRACNQVPRAP